MNAASPNTLGRALRGFFADHLPRVRGASPQTVQSYRDTFVLLLRFLAAQRRRSVIELDVEDLGPQAAPANSYPVSITEGPDGALWFTELSGQSPTCWACR